MTIAAGWVDPPRYKKGQDPLGVQQPLVALYSALLPGLTNVTDRVAYYGFGPWLAWAFARRHPEGSAPEFIETLRRSEVLLTLIAVRHAVKTDDGRFDQHAGALVGLNTLRQVAENMSVRSVTHLSHYATVEDVEERYFKNRQGGLGQYYLGVLRAEFHLLGQGERKGIDFTLEHGAPMAEAMAAGVDGDRFLRCVENDRVTTAELDSLARFCPCQLRTPGRSLERERHLDALLGRRPEMSETPGPRRATLALIIEFLRSAGGSAASSDPGDDFLTACYARTLPDRRQWEPPASLRRTADRWGFYLRGELFSIAMQRIFREALVVLEKEPDRLPNVEAAGRWCAEREPFVNALQRLHGKTYAALMEDTAAKLPDLANVEDDRNEISLWGPVIVGSDNAVADVRSAIRLIATLIARHRTACESISSELDSDQIRLEHYPINIDSIMARARERWSDMNLVAWIADAIAWALATHRQVAFRKLSQSGDDTRRLRMGELGLYVDGAPVDVARTRPRLRPALRFLEDLGLTESTGPNQLPRPTPEGLAFLRQVTDAG